MAQAEDTELRDLIVEALEKNGSLAKIRALLRANIFLAFEDECENMKHNINLDNVMKLPEGILALSIVHEFLEFCNLKNTLFVYMSESRQSKEYKYEGKRNLTEKLNIHKLNYMKEPVLTTLLKNILNPHNKTCYSHNDNSLSKHHEKSNINSYKDEQNCTYIVHEDSQSSTTSNSHSDNSSDEKNKLHLRLQLDNSDTDTSSDSAKDKSCSEYIPNEHLVINNYNKRINTQQHSGDCVDAKIQKVTVNQQEHISMPYFMHELKVATNSSSDSTSYVDLKPYTSLDEKLINTAGVPMKEIEEKKATHPMSKQNDLQLTLQTDSPKSAYLSSMSPKNEKVNISNTNQKNSPIESGKSEEYSYDFTSSQVSQNKGDIDMKQAPQPDLNTEDSSIKNCSVESQHQVSQSSQSSVSISDVADLISEKSYSFGLPANNEKSSDNKSRYSSNHSKKSVNNLNKSCSDDSGDFSESPIPSLSNLSLDIHSE